MMAQSDAVAWAVLWRSNSRLDGPVCHLMREAGVPKLFASRKLAKVWIKKEYGYIAHRKDFRSEPHCWRMPTPVRVSVSPR